MKYNMGDHSLILKLHSFSYLIQTFIEEFESSYIPLQQKAFTRYHEQAPGVLESFGPEVKMFDITNEMGNPFQEDSQN